MIEFSLIVVNAAPEEELHHIAEAGDTPRDNGQNPEQQAARGEQQGLFPAHGERKYSFLFLGRSAPAERTLLREIAENQGRTRGRRETEQKLQPAAEQVAVPQEPGRGRQPGRQEHRKEVSAPQGARTQIKGIEKKERRRDSPARAAIPTHLHLKNTRNQIGERVHETLHKASGHKPGSRKVVVKQHIGS